MNIAIILAGGIGKRMMVKDGTPKQFLSVDNKPILIHTLEKFEENENIDVIIVSCVEDFIPNVKKLLKKFEITKAKHVVAGGASYQMSCYNAMVKAKEICEDMDKDIIVVCDGVRPLVDDETITNNIKAAKETGAAITCVPCKETVALLGENNIIETTTNRSISVLGRAPQSFLFKDIWEIHQKALSEGITESTDNLTLFSKYGYKCTAVEGKNENIKITTPEDYYIFKAILEAKETSRIFGL